jgi:predicted nucleotidyltransferase component of viral defense system
MARLSLAQIIEAFHLAFLEVLRTRLNPARYVLKGGANLRYFFDSVRYSEDIDLDVSGVPGWALEEKIDALLQSPALAITLRSAGLAVVADEVGKPKQTDTTRRWKVPVLAEGRREPIRTKVEFSYRDGDHRHVLEAVPIRMATPYGLRPPTIQHYREAPATEQKVRALAGRSETQARDVFDLDLLLRRAPEACRAVDAGTRRAAAERGLELPYGAFADQVLPFLDPEVADLYDETAWSGMQSFVIDELLEEDR